MTLERLNECIDTYNHNIIFEAMMNENFENKKIRISNFPSHISENIAKFAYHKKYGRMPTWDTSVGDLQLIDIEPTQQLEVKGSIDLFNGGPSSYGPKEKWDLIYFVDGIDTLNYNYKVYEVRLSNTNDKWKNIKVSETQTYQQQANQGRRPRITFTKLIEQLDNNDWELIFDGHIDEFK